jgi:4a-hydroxytetrahydrobiopterin dehydratase
MIPGDLSNELTRKKCVPCEGGVPPVSVDKADEFLKSLPGWARDDHGKTITTEYLMKDFMAAVKFINNIAALAEQEDHHPDIHLTGYRKLRIDLSTHAIGGLSENDFILAAKINLIPKDLKHPKK